MDLRKLRLTERLTIAASPQQVWDVFSDLPRWPEWNPVCIAARTITGEPWQPGYRFHMVLRMGGAKVPFTPTVLKSSSPNSVTWDSTKLTITGTRTFTFEDSGRTTIATDDKLFESPFVPVAAVYPRPLIRTMSRRWLRALQREVDRHLHG